MKNKLLSLLACLVCVFGVSAQAFKGPESLSYYQLPTMGIKFKKVESFITLDQSQERAMMGAVSSKLGGALGENNTLSKAVDKVQAATKDITEVWDTWNLKPKYIRAAEGTGGTLRLELKYKPDDMGRPMTDPTPNASTGSYNLRYKVKASMKLTTEDGTVIMEKNFGELSGSDNISTPYKNAIDTENGMGTYEMLCVRKAMNKARQEVFGLYGFGVMDATIELGVIKEIKAAKKLIPDVLEVLENKKALVLTEEEKSKVKELSDVIEAGIGSCSDKTRWVAYHNLAVCYSFLEDEAKAKDYLSKYYEECKESFDKITTFGKPGGSKGYGTKDLKKYRGYSNIESFVTYYPKGASMYKPLLQAINRPLKKFTDFYTHNDLLCQIYSLDFPFQFFPLNDFEGSPKNAACMFEVEGMEHPIKLDYDFDSKRRIKELTAKQKYVKDDGSEDTRATRQMQPVYNAETGKLVVLSNPNNRLVSTTQKSDLRHFTPRMENQTYGKATNIMRSVGFMGGKAAYESTNVEFDLDGNMYFKGDAMYYAPVPIFKEILTANAIEVKRTDVKSDADAKARINEAGVLVDWVWTGDVDMSFSAGLSMSVRKANAKMVKHVKVVEEDEKGYPKKIEYTFSADGKFTVSTPVSFKQWLDATKQWSEAKPQYNNGEFSIPEVTIAWDCTYEYDDAGNWTTMQVGPYKATREFKY